VVIVDGQNGENENAATEDDQLVNKEGDEETAKMNEYALGFMECTCNSTDCVCLCKSCVGIDHHVRLASVSSLDWWM